MFHTVLVANRGEIALRVMRTCRSLGIRAVAIFTDTDRHAPHVREADDAVRVPGYLDVDAVVEAALATGAEAIHPGYGFLSENAGFARAVTDAGITFVGPTAAVMEQMGRKDAAREVAVAAGVPVVPTGDDAAYPVLVKAAAGGGGKGMRVVRTAEEHEAAVAAAQRESMSAFGDDTVLVEKYVERGRHIEVQVLADAHGHVVHLHERDCSAQRRHQKVIEEAPAPTLDDAARERVTSAAVALAREVGYTGAGTVEFLLDEDSGEAYFLEMNTRLQVEHPVTEAICGVDLVALQLRVAAGEELSLGSGPPVTGHAIEVRVYAEDPWHDFLPQAGTATLVHWPDSARIDEALESGQVVSTSYDPMLGKLIVHGPDRESARRALVAALDDTAILGLTTNTGFLRALAASEEFRDARVDTAWLDRNTLPAPDPDVALTLAAKAYAESLAADAHGDPFAADGWRLSGPRGPVLVEVDVAGERRVVRIEATATGSRVGWTTGPDGGSHGSGEQEPVDVVTTSREALPGAGVDAVRLIAAVDGRRHEAVVALRPGRIEVVHRGHRHVLTRPDRAAGDDAATGDGTVLAPMPGTLLAVDVEPGARVAGGQSLGMMEAMKMELALTAPFDGTVEEVGAGVGDQVALGARLFVVTPD